MNKPSDKAISSVDLNNSITSIFTSRNCLTITLSIIGSYILCLSCICIYKYLCFQYHDWDLAIYTNMMWNLVHGKPYSSLLAESLVRDHASFIAFPLALPYSIAPSPVTLLIFQTLALGISALPIFLLAREKLDPLSALVIILLYLTYPAIYYANLYEFYFEVFAVPFLSFAFYFLIKNRKMAFFFTVIAACACKENIPLTVSALGIFGLIRPRRRMLGLSALIIGIAWFYTDIRLMADPSTTGAAAFGSGLKYKFIFEQYGNNLQEVFLYIITHPLSILKDIFLVPGKIKLIYDTLGPLFFLPLIRADIIMINAPHALARLLSRNVNEYTVYFHSAAPLAPIIFYSLIYSLRSIFKKASVLKRYKYAVLGLLLALSVSSSISLWKDRPDITKFELRKDPIRADFVKEISKSASVIASFEFLPHLANREKIDSIQNYFGSYPRKRKPPIDLEYILIDMQDGVLQYMFFESDALFAGDLWKYLKEEGFGLVKARGDILLFKKGYPQTIGLIANEMRADLAEMKSPLKVDNNLSLLQANGEYLKGKSDILQFSFYWYADNNITSDYAIRFFVTEDNHDILCADHNMGYSLLPTKMWPRGYLIRENYWLVLPKLSHGEHSLSFEITNLTANKKAALVSPGKNNITQSGKYKICALRKET